MEDSLINQLPDTCLQHIFSFLPILQRLEAEKVCKHWRNISDRGWNDIKELNIIDEYSNNINYAIFKRCGRFLKKLVIYGETENSNCLSLVTQFCRLDQFEDITIFFDPHEENEKLEITKIRKLRHIFKQSRKLVALGISGTFISYTITALNSLNPRSLEELALANFAKQTLSINPDKFPNLKRLRLMNCTIFGDEKERDRESLKKLDDLRVMSCVIPQNFIERIATFTNLHELILRNNDGNIKNENISFIASFCCNIKKITLECPSSLTSGCFKDLGNIRSLEVLDLKSFSHVDNRDIAYLTNVKTLSFNTCENIIGDGLIDLIRNSSNLEALKFTEIKDFNRSFIEDIQQIFHSFQRQKLLHLTVLEGCNNEQFHFSQEIAHHPLLCLEIFDQKTDVTRGE